MQKYSKKPNNIEIKKNIFNKKYINNKSPLDNNLINEIRRSKIDIAKNSVPINYIKVDEKITTTVFKIPINVSIFREPNVNNNKENRKYIFYKKNVLNTINADKLHNKKKNNFFPYKPFSSTEMGYKYYKQKINSFYPHESNSKNCFYLRKNKSPPIQTTSISKRMKTCENYNHYHINNENINLNNRYESPTNNVKTKVLNSPFYQRFLNNSTILNNQKKLNDNSRIRHRIINLNRSNDFINNNSNKIYNYNNINNSSNEINNYNNTISNNSLHNIRRIYLDNNYNNRTIYGNSNDNRNIDLNSNKRPSNNIFSLKHSHIFHSPKIRRSNHMIFMEDKNIDNPNKFINYKHFNGGKIKNLIEKNKSNDGEYIIESISSNKIYDKYKIKKNDEKKKIYENDENKENILNTSRKDFGDNYRYLERNELKTTISNEKTNHIRRSPVHVYGFENYIIKDNKKILLQSPIKGKLIRIYRNNDKNCKMCFRNERKNREFGPVIKIKESNIFFPENFKKGKSNYFNTED